MRTRTLAAVGLAVVLTAGVAWAQMMGGVRAAGEPGVRFVRAGNFRINLDRVDYVVELPDGVVRVRFRDHDQLLSPESGRQLLDVLGPLSLGTRSERAVDVEVHEEVVPKEEVDIRSVEPAPVDTVEVPDEIIKDNP